MIEIEPIPFILVFCFYSITARRVLTVVGREVYTFEFTQSQFAQGFLVSPSSSIINNIASDRSESPTQK